MPMMEGSNMGGEHQAAGGMKSSIKKPSGKGTRLHAGG